MIIDYLTLADAGDPQISGKWITGFVVAIIGAVASGVALVIGKRQGKAEAVENVTQVKGPVPTVTMRAEPVWATHDELAAVKADLDDLRDDVDRKLDQLLAGQSAERSVARESLGKVHMRIDTLSERLGERLSHLEGSVKSMEGMLEKLIDLALTKKPGTGR